MIAEDRLRGDQAFCRAPTTIERVLELLRRDVEHHLPSEERTRVHLDGFDEGHLWPGLDGIALQTGREGGQGVLFVGVRCGAASASVLGPLENQSDGHQCDAQRTREN